MRTLGLLAGAALALAACAGSQDEPLLISEVQVQTDLAAVRPANRHRLRGPGRRPPAIRAFSSLLSFGLRQIGRRKPAGNPRETPCPPEGSLSRDRPAERRRSRLARPRAKLDTRNPRRRQAMRRSPGDWIGLALLHKRPRIALSGAPVARRAIRSAGAQAEAEGGWAEPSARNRGAHRFVSARSVKGNAESAP